MRLKIISILFCIVFIFAVSFFVTYSRERHFSKNT